MAIAKIKKLEVIGLNTDRNSLLALLQQAGITQLINIRQSDIPAPLIPVISDADLLGLQEAISYLATLKKSPGFLSGIAASKPLVYQQELKEVIDKSDWKA
ncbi:MAG: hypothetical protein ACM3IL_05645, partial [Deltaproteobacteria bacterium]